MRDGCLSLRENWSCEANQFPGTKGTCRVKTIRQGRPPVKVGRDDPSLTPSAGVVLIAEMDRILGVAGTIDAHVGRIKKRRQGLSGGQVVLAMAVPTPPASTTFNALAQRFDDVAIADLEAAVGELVGRGFALMPEPR